MTDQRTQLTAYFATLATPERQARIDQVLRHRTRHITVVLENVYHGHNASAVLRSCDCFGVQDVHVMAGKNPFRPVTGIARGAAKWLTVHHHKDAGGDGTGACFQRLREQGYRIVATTLRPGAIPVRELPVNERIAVCFGSEEDGLSDTAHDRADTQVFVPMLGFTQSFNISVAAALCLAAVRENLERSAVDWRLTPDEEADLRLKWLIASVPHGDAMARHFAEEHGWEAGGL